eukprot:gene15031-17232_t
MVKRGNCAFSTKALNAQQAGFELVIIVDSEEEGFPVGPPELDFVLDVPVVMVGQKVWEQVYDSNMDRALSGLQDVSSAVDKSELASALEGCYTVSLSFAPALSPTTHTASPASNVQPGSSDKHKLHTTKQKLLTPHSHSDATDSTVDTAIPTISYTTYLVQALVYMFIVTVFVGIRLGTLRIYSTTDPQDPTQVVYNHRETDERVFETLMRNVLNNFLDYRLHPHTIQELHLAEENYSDSVFIHPPLFVYLSAALHRFCAIPIPFIPIVLQTLALCLLPVISKCVLCMVNNLYAVFGGKDEQNRSDYFSEGDIFSVGVTAMLILSCCPIAAFSSQKFWIDNCLFLSVTVCVAAHVSLLHCNTAVLSDAHAKGKLSWYNVDRMWRHAVSGIIFGLVGLNCKITAAALLLFLVGWSFLQQYLMYQTHYALLLAESIAIDVNGSDNMEQYSDAALSRKHKTLLRQAVGGAVVNCAVFGLCALLTYAPWIYIYWIHTGRLTPNAWPSATMLQRSSFVRAAVNKPWYTYLYTLTSVAPVHIVGLVGTVVLTLCSMPTVIERVVYGLHVLSGGDSEIAYIQTADDNSTAVGAVGSVASNDGESNVTASGFSPTTPVDRRASLRRRCKEPSVPSTTPASAPASALNQPLPTQKLPSRMLPQVHSSSDVVDPFVLTLLLFSLWPVGFLVGLTVLGSAGSGFQSRFLMPMLPDLDVSLVDILCSILQSVYSAPASREEFRGTLKFMGHYGLVRETS